VLAKRGALDPAAIDDFRPEPADAEARARLQAEYLERVFRELVAVAPQEAPR
jgi:hypothetical protein